MFVISLASTWGGFLALSDFLSFPSKSHFPLPVLLKFLLISAFFGANFCGDRFR